MLYYNQSPLTSWSLGCALWCRMYSVKTRAPFLSVMSDFWKNRSLRSNYVTLNVKSSTHIEAG